MEIRYNETIWTNQTKVDKVIQYEKTTNANVEFLNMNVTLSKSIYPLIDTFKIAKPLIVKREQNGFLPLYVEYFYSEPDSILRYISYDWERAKFDNLFKKKEILKEESNKLKEYNSEYERIKRHLLTQLGAPIKEDLEPQKILSNENRGEYFTRSTTWDSSDYHAELKMIFESMTYRIRMNYYWKK
jgi:hypothetical protein